MRANLHWDPNRSNAVYTIGGTGWLTGMKVGDRVVITYDHSDVAEFALAEPPNFEISADFTVYVLANGTDGRQWSVEVVCTSSGGEYPGSEVCMYTWTRRGVLV